MGSSYLTLGPLPFVCQVHPNRPISVTMVGCIGCSNTRAKGIPLVVPAWTSLRLVPYAFIFMSGCGVIRVCIVHACTAILSVIRLRLRLPMSVWGWVLLMPMKVVGSAYAERGRPFRSGMDFLLDSVSLMSWAQLGCRSWGLPLWSACSP